jgi:hypothetical protein
VVDAEPDNAAAGEAGRKSASDHSVTKFVPSRAIFFGSVVACAWVAYYFVHGRGVADWIVRIVAFFILMSLGLFVAIRARRN